MYQINGFLVDCERCEISANGHSETLEPKVMEVLKYFVERPHSVIDQQQLFDAVWPQRIFSQSLVQRAIAILRKALGDDASSQIVIKTHPKKGYSLVAECKPWPEKAKLSRLWLVAALSVCVAALLVVTHDFTSLKHSFNHIQPVTSASNSSYAPAFSPDGTQLAYIQDTAVGKQRIWLNPVNTGQHYPLTLEGNYLSVTWSPDATQIAYVSKRESHYQLGTIRLNDSLTKAVSADVIINDFDAIYVSPVQWAANNTWYFAAWKQDEEMQSTLYAYDLNTSQRTTLIETSYNNRFKAVKLSPDQQYLALTHYSQPENFELGIFSLRSSEYTLLHKAMSQQLDISWHPDSQHIVLSTENQQSYIDINGEETALTLPDYQHISGLEMSPEGNKVAYTQSQPDSDIIEYISADNSVNVRANSNAIDISARYSPDQKRLAYLSKRAGYMQVFVISQGTESLVYANPTQADILGPAVWSGDGSQLAVSQNHAITLIDVQSGNATTIAHLHEHMFIYDWYHNERALLVGFIDKHGIRSARLNLDTLALTNLTVNPQGGFTLNAEDALMYSDSQALYVAGKRLAIALAPGEAIVSSILPVADGLVFQTQNENGRRLWKYNTQDNNQRIIMNLPDTIWRLEDVSPALDRMVFTSHMKNEKNIMLVD